MIQRRIKDTIISAFDRLGYRVGRKKPPTWGDNAFVDQQRLLAGAPVRVIVDGGANVGDTVDVYRGLFPSAVIHAFEPFSPIQQKLAQRFASLPQIHAHQSALSDVTGMKRFYVNDVDVTSSLLHMNAEGAEWARASSANLDRHVDVPSTTLDAFCSRHRLAQIDVLKLDIQGGEGMALEGAEQLLARHAIRLVYTEVLFGPLYEGQAYFCDVSRILERHRYRLFGLYDLHHSGRGLGWADAIFLAP